jgi:hypothetical protein
MRIYFRSNPGRLLALALAIPLATGAVLPWNADNIGYFTAPIMGAIGLAVFAVGLSVDKHPGHAIIATLFLPVALFLYLPTLAFVIPAVPAVTYLLAAAAMMLMAVAARPGLPAYRPLQTTIQHPAHDHS